MEGSRTWRTFVTVVKWNKYMKVKAFTKTWPLEKWTRIPVIGRSLYRTAKNIWTMLNSVKGTKTGTVSLPSPFDGKKYHLFLHQYFIPLLGEPSSEWFVRNGYRYITPVMSILRLHLGKHLPVTAPLAETDSLLLLTHRLRQQTEGQRHLYTVFCYIEFLHL